MNLIILFELFLIFFSIKLISCTFWQSTLSSLTSESKFQLSSNHSWIEDVQKLIDSVINDTIQHLVSDYKIETDSYNFIDSHFRNKRSIYQNLNKAVNDLLGAFRLTSISSSFSVCPYSSGVELIKFKNWTLCICFSSYYPFNITLGTLDYSRHTFNPWPSLKFTSKYHSQGPVRVKAFSLEEENTFYLLIADESKSSPAIEVLEIDENFNLKKISAPNVNHPTAFQLFYPKGFVSSLKTLTGKKFPHLIIANQMSQTQNSNHDYKSIVKIFHWKNDSRTFDEYDFIHSYLVKDICPFSIENDDYLVIVNYKDGLYQHHVDSELYKFDIEKGKYLLVHKITTYGAVDCEIFTLGPYSEREYFLAIANEHGYIGNQLTYQVNSAIYKFSINKFVPFQCIKTQGARQIKAIEGPESSIVLSISSHIGIRFYEYNGWIFVESKITNPLLGSTIQNIQTLPFLNKMMLMVNGPRLVSKTNVYRLIFTHDHSLKDWYQNSLTWCNNTLAMINDHDLDYFNNLLQNVYYINQPQDIEIDGDLIFTNDLDVSEVLLTPRVQVYENRELDYLDHRYVLQINELEKRVQNFEESEKNLKNLFNLALKLNENQEVSGTYSFDEVNFKCLEKAGCQIDKINVQNLNGRNVVNLTNNVIRLDHDEKIYGNLRFQTIATQNKLTTYSINNLNPKTFVTKTGNHKLKGETVFDSSLLVDDLRVDGTINGHIITRDTVLVSDGYQHVKSVLTFAKPMSIRNLNVTGLVTNFNTSLNSFLNNIIIKNGYHKIKGIKHFKHLTIENLNLKPGTTLNGVDVVNLYDNLFWTTGDQTITAPINFSNLKINGHIYTNGTVNNLPFNRDYYVFSKGTSIVNKTKVFWAPVVTESAYVQHSINGIKNLNGSLNLMLKNKPQTVTGAKTFFNIQLNANVNILGTVNDMSISNLVKQFENYLNIPLNAGKKKIVGNLELYGPLTIGGKINGINLKKMFYETFKLNDTQIPNIKLRFQSLTASSVNSRLINGYDLVKDFLTTNTPQTLNGSKIFAQNLMVNHHLNIETFNELNINKSLSNSLFRTSSQLISGFKVFYGDLYVDNLNVKFINDADMYDLVLINRSGIITGAKQFGKVKVYGDTIASHIPSLRILNNNSFYDIYYNSLRRDLPQRVTGLKHFAEIIVTKGQNLMTSNINGYNLKTIAKNLVYKDVDYVQEIYGRKNFYGSTHFEQFNFNHSFEGVSSKEFTQGWLQKNKNQVIYGNINLMNDVRVHQDLIVRKKINNIDIARLNQTIVKTNEPNVLLTNLSMSNAHVDGYINVGGTINGMRLREEAVQKNSSHVQVLTGYKYFMKGLQVEKSLKIYGLLNKISLKKMCLNAANQYNYQIFNQSLIIKGDLIVPALYLYGLINNVNFKELNQSTILTSDTLISGRKHFKNLIIEGPTSLFGRINNVDLKSINDNCLSKTRSQVIKSPIMFQDGLVLNGLTRIRGNLKTAKNIINNINLSYLYNTSLLNNGYQELKGDYVFINKVYFNSSLSIPGSIILTLHGPLNLKQDIMLKTRSNIVNGPTIFESPVIFSSNATINLKKNFGGINMNTFEKTAVLNRPKMDIIYDRKYFNSLEVNELFINGYLSNILFQDKYILRSDKDEIIDGKMIFKNDLRVKGNLKVSGSVNNINLTNLEHRLVLKGKKNTITAPIYFNIKPRIVNITSSALFGGLNVTNVHAQVNIADKMKKMQSKLNFQENKLTKLNNILKNQAYCFEYYDFLDRINNARLLPTGSKSQTSNGFYLLDQSQREQYPCDSIQVRKYDGHAYSLIQNIITYQPVGAIDFWFKNEKYLIIISENPFDASNKYATKCLQRGSSSNYTLTGNGNSMVQILKHDKKTNQFVPTFRLATNKPKAIKFLETPFKRPCVIFTFLFNKKTRSQEAPSIYCLTSSSNNMQAHLEFIETLESETKGADKVAVLASKYLLTTFLVTLNTWQASLKNDKVRIFKLSENGQSFGKSIQKINALFPTAGYLVESIQESATYFWLADGKNKRLGNKPITRVFKYYPSSTSEPFKEIQKIWDSKENNIVSIDSTIMPDSSLMIFLLTEGNLLKLYKNLGTSGFQLISTLNTRDSNLFIILNTYSIYGHLNGNHLLLSKSDCQDDNDQNNNAVYILGSKMRGMIF